MTDERERALAVLADGGVVAAATETLFGLLADATRPEAIDRLFALKPRADKGVPILLPSRAAWATLVLAIPDPATALADAFWPGPLTIVLAAAASLDPRLTQDGTVGVRLGARSPAQALAERLGRPLTATSANPPGEPATAEAARVERAFAAAVAAGNLFVLGDPAPGGPPSTVVVVRSDRVEVVREGAISRRELGRIVAL